MRAVLENVNELKRTELKVQSERTILVRVLLPGPDRDRLDPLDELKGLATTAGAIVVGTMTQKRSHPDKATYLGRGKIEELSSLVGTTKTDMVIFDNELSPAQIRNLEKTLDVKVLDRTEVILDIFASRARSHQARLQVELAQLEYALPRLKRMWTHLSRIEGGIGMRGPGEKQLEEDRRIVDRRVADLRDKLRKVEARKQREVEGRSEQLTVAIVGYTNAGKSTLMNALTEADVLAEDKLFATLDTRTRRWVLSNLGTVLLSDTVGFIRDLPHNLVASFKATLEEVLQAKLLIHVVDASSEHAANEINAVNQVLDELKCGAKPLIMVLNKVDQVPEQSYLNLLQTQHPAAVVVSAKNMTGLDALEQAVARSLEEDFLDVTIEADQGNGKVQAYLKAHAVEISREFEDDRVIIQCRLEKFRVGDIYRLDGIIHRHTVLVDEEP